MEKAPLPDDVLQSLRLKRSELREAMGALEQALARPVSSRGSDWTERVHIALVELSVDLREHVDITERPDGLHEEIVRTVPRLAHGVHELTRDHQRLRELLDEALSSAGGPDADERVDHTRELGTALLGRLVRHRQRSSDLVYEAFAADLGGET